MVVSGSMYRPKIPLRRIRKNELFYGGMSSFVKTISRSVERNEHLPYPPCCPPSKPSSTLAPLPQSTPTSCTETPSAGCNLPDHICISILHQCKLKMRDVHSSSVKHTSLTFDALEYEPHPMPTRSTCTKSRLTSGFASTPWKKYVKYGGGEALWIDHIAITVIFGGFFCTCTCFGLEKRRSEILVNLAERMGEPEGERWRMNNEKRRIPVRKR